MTPSALRIIGIGNPLMGDDGLGITAIERLRAVDLPQAVELIDGGTGGLTLLHLMEGATKVIFIDAVVMQLPPGSIRRIDDLLPRLTAAPEQLSLHETGLAAALALGESLEMLPPQLVLFGVEPQEVAPSLELTPAVSSILPELVEQVRREVASCR
ncbi:MAG: hydrogenase [Desulfuromonas sp.]|nr:MAG: hydrogenase [Desulfuromonas sp.]